MKYLIVVLALLLVGCEEEKPFKSVDVIGTVTRYVPEETRIRYHANQKIMISIRDKEVHQLSLGKCSLEMNTGLIGHEVKLRRDIYYNQGSRYLIYEGEKEEILEKYCY